MWRRWINRYTIVVCLLWLATIIAGVLLMSPKRTYEELLVIGFIAHAVWLAAVVWYIERNG